MTHSMGRGSLTHNNRDFVFKNVDPTRTKDNIVYVKQTLEGAYEHLFSEAVQNYNVKQKRSDRRISDYYEHVFGKAGKTTPAEGSNREKSFYETVVGVGTMFDSGVGSADGALVAKCLDEYMKGFQERNPQFHVFNAVLHMDEATPHLHIDHIPVANYSSGLAKRNSSSKALEQMGHGTGKDAISRWRIAERKVLEEICNKHGIEISEPQQSRGTVSVEVYKELATQAKEEFFNEWAEYIELAEQTELQDNARHEEMEAKHITLVSDVQILETKKKELQEWHNREKNRLAIKSKAKFDELPKPDYKKHRYEFNKKGKKTGFILIPEDDHKIMQRQSGWYRRGIGLDEREAAVAKREQAATDAQRMASEAQARADALYQQQLTLSQTLMQTQTALTATKKALQDSQTANTGLKSQVATLTQELTATRNSLRNTENALVKIIEESGIFTPIGNQVAIGGIGYRDIAAIIKAEKPEHRVLERVMERDQELQYMLTRDLELSL